MGETSSCRLKDTLDVDLRRCLKIDIRSSSLNTDSLAMAYLHDFFTSAALGLEESAMRCPSVVQREQWDGCVVVFAVIVKKIG